MSGLSIFLLGSFEAVVDERPITKFRTKAVQALLIYLVCQPESHARETLMTLLWPDLPLKSAQANLRHALYHLKQVVPEVDGLANEAVPFVVADRQTIQINPDGRFHLDITQFETLCQSKEPENWESAVSLYRGDFLSDFFMPDSPTFETWAQARRTDLRRRLLDTLVRLTDHHLMSDNFEQAEQYARQQLAVDNLREEAHRQLMEILARSGRRIDALSHYSTLQELLKDELDVDPSKETETLVEAIQSDSLIVGGGVEIEKRQESKKIPDNLPVQTTPFIGRKSELAALDELLADPKKRLVTILGAGGMGKTRLSLEAANRQLNRMQFPQGVFFVSLAGLGESNRIVSAIGEALEIRLEQGETQLLNYLQPRQILLVLDNFEHLLDGSDLVIRLIDAAPDLHILVTSRERLRLQGEQVYPIQGLVVDESAAIDDSRSLFIHAARRLRPDFEAHSENLPTLNHICRLVEGMPLALELAAAWVDLFTLEDIASEIQRNLDFFESDLRDIPSRHRSMQAVFDASWQQLSTKLQKVLAAIGVFRGGFTREAASAITQASLHDLATLVNKSLISFDANTNRYHIHELLRQYSLAHLTKTAVQERHSAYYLNWLVQQAPKITGAEQLTSIALIKREMDNIRVAINQALESQKVDNFTEVVQALGQFYQFQPRSMEVVSYFAHLQAQLSKIPDPSPQILFWLIVWQVHGLGGMGFKTRANQLWEAGKSYLAELALQDGDIRYEQAFAAYTEGYNYYLNPGQEAHRLLQKSYELAMELGNHSLAGDALYVLGKWARNNGDLTTAEEAGSQSLSLFQTLHDQDRILGALILLAEIAAIDGRYQEAEHQLSKVIATARQSQNTPGYALSKLQMVYFFSGQFQKAKTPLTESQLVDDEKDYIWGILRNDISLGLLYLHGDGNYPEAQIMGQQALELGQDIENDFFVCESLVLLLQGDIVLENLVTARERLKECDNICLYRSVGYVFYVAGTEFYSGILALITGKTAVARQHLHTELEMAVHRRDKLNVANALAAFALLYASENQTISALETYSVAQQHPFIANSHWFADVIGKRISAASANLSPAEITSAQARGKEMDIWQTAETILNTLKS